MLSDIRILDFSTLLPGPYASMMLADLGAEVLRVESSTRTDLLREMTPKVGESSAAHQYLNRSKKSISLDLKKLEAIEIIKELVKKYDVVLEQFRPGVMNRLGIGYEKLKEINPSIIYCAITGYGQTGPYKNRAGHDLNYLSISGISSYSKRKKQAPVPQGVQIADVAGGSLHSVIGILTALHHRQKTGQGQFIDISMTDCAFALNVIGMPETLASNNATNAESNLLNGGTFYDYYQTSDGRYMSIGSIEPKFFNDLCKLLNLDDLIPLANKTSAQKEIKDSFTQAFKTKSFTQWQDIFTGLDLCVEPVLDLKEASNHPQLIARNMIIEVPDKQNSLQKQLSNPIKFSNYQSKYQQVGAEVGADSNEILSQLGFNATSIAMLKKDGVVNNTN
ncbi:carnitine dehydratase [Pseudoalteromonas sp. NBT06-2]|uniref:CaiB/BaiF CoA transferase family protein n=1 Tax=Pseudoalteromonas sp. NBT06-2 TaxID=2025950 RepID=UPI000BA71C26|nr:CaiB/BaiF CoA-transferase family protein [Pseudoalteromonas sp. NBT06-2]PAJ74608.1 carnitine dehydratase [Pseudoalteromonas sp. NBT06-2]